MSKSRMILAIMFAISCGKSPARETVLQYPDIADKASKYLDLAKQSADANKWPVSDCDALLWASLYNVAGGDADLDKARDASGKWYRTPSHDCYPSRSKSSISQDMILGLVLASWQARDAGRIAELIKYGEDHVSIGGWWLFGEGAPSRTLIRTNLQSTIYRASRKLGGPSNRLADFPPVFAHVQGYEAHLHVLHILLKGLIDGSITSYDLGFMRYFAERAPRNALFQAILHRFTDGDYSTAAQILRDEALFPSDRLPTSAERCEPYLWQREEGESWQSCPTESKQHPGIDFMLAAYLIK